MTSKNIVSYLFLFLLQTRLTYILRDVLKGSTEVLNTGGKIFGKVNF